LASRSRCAAGRRRICDSLIHRDIELLLDDHADVHGEPEGLFELDSISTHVVSNLLRLRSSHSARKLGAN
jgi:hypothetical protein